MVLHFIYLNQHNAVGFESLAIGVSELNIFKVGQWDNSQSTTVFIMNLTFK